MGESTTGVHVKLDDPAQFVTRALDEAIAEIAEKNVQMLAQITQLERQLEQQYGQAVKVPSRADGLAAKAQLLQKRPLLVVNTMFYLAAEPDDIEDDWERGTPRRRWRHYA